MSKKWRIILAAAAAAMVLALVLLFVYYNLLPRISYRRLVNSVTPQGAILTAKAEKEGEEYWLSDSQILAVVSWLAEYRSENNGIAHSPEGRGTQLTLHYGDPDGRAVVLYLESRAIVFPGILGSYRIEVDTNDIYTLINNLNEV